MEEPKVPPRKDRAGDDTAAPDRSARAGEDASAAPPLFCDLCDAAMYELHCRLICPRCGYQRDCSDP